MKKLITAFTAITLAAFTLFTTSCSKDNEDSLKVVATIYPEYNWVEEITAGVSDIDLTLIVDSRVDLHSFQPSVSDIADISTADLFIYTGGESEEWVEDALANKKNDDMVVLNLIELLGDKALEEEEIEGAEEHHHEDEEEHHHEDGEEHHHEYDEHTWLSLKNTVIFTEAIKDAFISIDSKNQEAYTKNASSYIEKLNTLDNKYQEAIQKGTKSTLLFGDRFPFLYFTKDYNLSYYAAFSGCSAETEASFETIVFLANKLDELNLKVILTIEGGNTNIAETIKNNTTNKDQEILTLNSIQSVLPSDNTSYLKIMEENLEVITKAVA